MDLGLSGCRMAFLHQGMMAALSQLIVGPATILFIQGISNHIDRVLFPISQRIPDIAPYSDTWYEECFSDNG
jgi:hypothetical protein